MKILCHQIKLFWHHISIVLLFSRYFVLLFHYVILVIVVTGGYNKSYITKTVEAISLEGTPLCTLPDLPDERRRHTMDDDIMCGGYSTKTSCLRYVAGEWTRFRRNLVNSRSNQLEETRW